jgi:hypothetical protein
MKHVAASASTTTMRALMPIRLLAMPIRLLAMPIRLLAMPIRLLAMPIRLLCFHVQYQFIYFAIYK